MSDVIVSLYGGLGNQLFQYAAARALAWRTQSRLVFDLAWFGEDHVAAGETPRSYALAPFRIPATLSSGHARSRIGSGRVGRLARSCWESWRSSRGGIPLRREAHYHFDPEVLRLPAPIWIDGYWQSPKYFEDAAHIIRKEIGTVGALSPAARAVHEKILASDAVSVHVRRGDYVTHSRASQVHGLCSLDYYRAGVELAAVGLTRPHCFVFTDDPQWVQAQFDLGGERTIVDVNGPDDAHQDLWLMAACKNFVIANSSLSWWGAWLGDAPRKVVVAPSRWFLTQNQDTTDLCPEQWLRV